MSHYAGLDISMKSTSIAIMDSTGAIFFESIVETDPSVIAETIENTGFTCEKIGIEAGSISFWLLDELKDRGLKAICVESHQMSTLINLKVNKTDKNDARIIANAMRCNLYKEVFHKTKESIDAGIQLGLRRLLIDTRTRYKNNIRGLLKAYGIRLGNISHGAFSEAVRVVLSNLREGARSAIEHALGVYQEVCERIQHIEKEIDALCKQNSVVNLLMSIPGIGKITALTYKTTISDPHRFDKPSDVGAYIGLTPTQYSSGESTKQGRISRRGSKELRTLLIECAIVILTRIKVWTKLRAWGLKIMKRSGIKKAAAAIGRKLAIIMLRMWQDEKNYEYGMEELVGKKKTKDRVKKQNVAVMAV